MKPLIVWQAEELKIGKNKSKDEFFYIPIIITTADIKACNVKPVDISLSDGTIKKTDFKSIPFIRFRKSLVTQLNPDRSPQNLKESNEDRERTVIILNSSFLPDFLNNLKFISDIRYGNPFPWITA